MSMGKVAVQTKGLNRKFDNGVQAVRDVTINLQMQKFYAIMGHSGSGKTTLLQVLGLLDKPTSGEVLLMGQDITKMSSDKKADMRMKHIGFVFQSYYLNSRMTAMENVMLPMHINSQFKDDFTKKRAVALSLLEELGLADRANHFPKELSGGEQQRVAIARALANDPSCIFADEPTGNLDYENEINVLDILKKISQKGKCVLVVTHNSIVKEYADAVGYMDKGILKSGEHHEK